MCKRGLKDYENKATLEDTKMIQRNNFRRILRDLNRIVDNEQDVIYKCVTNG